MPRYQILGLNVELPWSLELPSIQEPAAVRIVLGPPEPVPRGPQGERFVMSRTSSGLELSVGGSCRVVVSTEGPDVLCLPDSEIDPRELRREVLEHLIPRLLSRHRALVLHASSVVFNGSAFGFLASSGSGKSTLALALARRGATLMGDDSLVIDPSAQGAIAHPLWSSVRVHTRDLADTLRARLSSPIYAKSALHEGDDPSVHFTRKAHPLRAIYVLEQAGQIAITRMAAHEALLALLRETYHLEFDDMPGLARLMSRVEELGLTHRTYQLAYPRDFDRLDEVCDRVAAHAACT